MLESALMSAREVCDVLCEQTGAEGVQVVGSKFVIYRKSEKLERERKAQAQPKAAKSAKKKVNPVKQGIRNRRKAAKEERERRDKYFHDAAVQAATERRKQQGRGEQGDRPWQGAALTAGASTRRTSVTSARRRKRAAASGSTA